MKHLSKMIVAIIALLSFASTTAQDKNNPWSISLGVNAVDYYPVDEEMPQGEFLDEFFNATDHWNIFPFASRLEITRYLNYGFSVSAITSINRIRRFGSNVDPSSGLESVNEVDDLGYIGLDAAVNYSLMELLNSNRIDPFLRVGGGYTWLDGIGSGTVNGGLGFRYWFSERFAFQLETTYKHVFETYGFKHFQHAFSVTLKFGGKDTDRDGIYDTEDACPNQPGSIIFNGCPDTDNDGIEDPKDKCPNVSGTIELNGCPDTDNDGVIDEKDDCPSLAGLKLFNGCPDGDKDGIIDLQDKCPQTFGPSENGGCPWPDSDGDGVLDKDDNCINKKGPKTNNGCPETISETERDLLNEYAKTILFSSGRAAIKPQSRQVLDGILQIIQKYPNTKFTIDGHTDNEGSYELNQRLSEQRADAVRRYLVTNGANPLNLSSQGFGESKPIASNDTASGRNQNRRVEINMVKR